MTSPNVTTGYANISILQNNSTATYYCESCNAVVTYPHMHFSDSAGGAYFYPPPCYSCGYCHEYGSPCVPPRIHQSTPEEPEVTDDKRTIDTLRAMRDGRDNTVQLAQEKNDQASLLELEAARLRGEAQMILREANEQRNVRDAK